MENLNDYKLPPLLDKSGPTVAELELIPFFNLSIDMLCIADVNGFFKRINPAFETVLGYKREELLVTPFTNYLHHDDVEGTLKKLKKVVMLGSSEIQFENRFRCKDGSYKWLSWRAFFVRSKEESLYAVIRDVTEEKEIDRMKTEFISLASHQLKTPLSSIKWFGEMLLNGDPGPLNPSQTEMVVGISSSTQRMIELVNSLLDVSRIESGRLVLEPSPTDVVKVLEELLNELKVKSEPKKQRIKVTLLRKIPEANVDKKMLRNVMMNLLTNAIKYSSEGSEILITFSVKDGMIVCDILDHGYGIPKSDQGKMFQKFYRAENAVRLEPDGNGLGLYMAKYVIEASGGKIWFESEEGKGTKFSFSLPVVPEQLTM